MATGTCSLCGGDEVKARIVFPYSGVVIALCQQHRDIALGAFGETFKNMIVESLETEERVRAATSAANSRS